MSLTIFEPAVRAAVKPNFENLILGGPGVNGLCLVGAIEQVEKEIDTLQKIKRVAGASSGAIIALMIALGYNANDITKTFINLNFTSDIVHNQKVLRGVLSYVISKQLKYPDTTFAGLVSAGFADLHIAVTLAGRDITQQAFIFSNATTPNASVLLAVLASAATPGLFPAVFLTERHGKYIEADNTLGLANLSYANTYTDGGYSFNPDTLFNPSQIALKILDCSGYRGYMNFNNNHDTILINQGQQPEAALNLYSTPEKYAFVMKGRTTVADAFHPENVDQVTRALSEEKLSGPASFARSTGRVSQIGMYGTQNRARPAATLSKVAEPAAGRYNEPITESPSSSSPPTRRR